MLAGINLTLLAAIVLGATSLVCMLPPKRGWTWCLGSLLAFVSFGLFATLAASFTEFTFVSHQSLFWLISLITLSSCLATIVARNPVYAALWFGLALVSTASLILIAGAQFLSVAIISVYAGAILVTLLFILMLATPSGAATYDRLTWEPLLSATAGAVMVGVLSVTIMKYHKAVDEAEASGIAVVEDAESKADNILHPQHVAHLGRELFGTHLISVEVAGILLFVGLVGAAAVVAHGRAREQNQPLEQS